MSKKIFWQLLASVLFLAYAIFKLIPFETTPFEIYVKDRATAHEAEFKKILDEADTRVKNWKNEDVPADKKSQTMYNALRDIGAGKGEDGKIHDLNQFFPDIKIVAGKKTGAKERHSFAGIESRIARET